ncbi:MAG: DUF2723 domain-containing protein [Spirochaetes bacterium]|nr:DUF2723 domain-containing protein [Spirochaetota bacterium]
MKYFKNFSNSNIIKKTLDFLPWIAIFLLAILYLTTLSLHIIPGDSAEFVTASVTLGVCHPTGYPLYVLLGKIATILFFFISPEIVINAMSCVFFLASLIFIVLTLQKLKFSSLTIAISIGVLGITPSIWNYSTLAEVYTLHALLFSIIIFLMVSFIERPRYLKLLLIVFFAGISLGNHMTSVLIFPGILIWMILIFRKKLISFNWYQILYLIIIFILASSTVLLIFIFDRFNTLNYITQFSFEFPHLKLDSPINRFIWLITGAQYNAVHGLKEIFSLNFLKNIYKELLIVASDNAVLFILGSFGLISLIFKQNVRKYCFELMLFLRITFLINILYFSTYLWAFEPIFFIHAYIICVFGLVIIIDNSFNFRTNKLPLAAIFLIIFCFFIVTDKYSKIDKSKSKMSFHIPFETFFDKIEKNAVVFSSWGNSTIFWYLQWVKGKKTEVFIVNAVKNNYIRLAKNFPNRPLYFERIPGGINSSSFKRLYGFYKLNPKAYDSTIKYPNLISLNLKEAIIPKSEGTPWNYKNNTIFNNYLAIDLHQNYYSKIIKVSLDNNDIYKLIFIINNTEIDYTIVPRKIINIDGLSLRIVNVPIKAKEKGYNKIIIQAIQGDGKYSFGHIELSESQKE